MHVLIRRPKPNGIFFALWPRCTPKGWAVGWMHRHWIEAWGWGSDGYWVYTNWVPQKEYDADERAERAGEAITFSEQLYGVNAKHLGDLPANWDNANQRPRGTPEAEARHNETWEQEQERLHKNPPNYYATPPDKSKCRNNDGRATVPCWYPHCSCMEPKP